MRLLPTTPVTRWPVLHPRILVCLAVLTAMYCASTGIPPGGPGPRGTIIYAQSLPTTVTVTWDPNPAGENVTQYLVTLDTGPALPPTLPASCPPTPTPIRCTQSVPVGSFGSHTLTVVAQNLKLSPGTALQAGPATSVAFTLNSLPTAPKNPGVQ